MISDVNTTTTPLSPPSRIPVVLGLFLPVLLHVLADGCGTPKRFRLSEPNTNVVAGERGGGVRSPRGFKNIICFLK